MTASESKDLRIVILAAAKRLFIQHGYHGLAMRQIAEEVGVTKAALYYHFKDKEALFLAILKTYLDEIQPALRKIQAEGKTCRQKLEMLVRHILRQPAEHRAVIRLASQEMSQLSQISRRDFRIVYEEKFIGPVRAILADGMQQGEIRPVDSNLATWVLLGMLFPYLYPAHKKDISLSDQNIEQIISIYLDGVATPVNSL